MNRRLPTFALLLGLGGLLPFIGCGLLALTQYDDRGMAALAAYGAVILSFLGAVHWGFALPEPSGRGERARLLGGVVPALVAWVALLAGFAVRQEVTLAILLVGFVGTAVVEARGMQLGLVPPGYMRLRWVLTVVVVAVLLLVLVARLAGLHLA